MNSIVLSDAALATIFTEAHTFYSWQEREVSDETLEQIYHLAKMGPTAMNCGPLRVIFVKGKKAKEKLKPSLDVGNVEKTMAAPVTAIFAYDLKFYENLSKLFPVVNTAGWFSEGSPNTQEVAFRNGTLQAAYFMVAARAVGLDCGPMSGFNQQAVNETFFSHTTWKSNFLCNLGYGRPESFHPRLPRLEFATVCIIK